MERVYFDGQRDTINGNVWAKSCWNNGERPFFNPTYIDTNK